MKVLKIDIDFQPPERWLKLWIETRFNMLRSLGYTPYSYSTFETTRGIHIYIHLKEELPDETVNMLQFLCGDDPTRVKINQWRIKRKIPHWNKLFFKVKYRKKAKTVTCYYCGNIIPLPEG
jgi:hypothetical protein